MQISEKELEDYIFEDLIDNGGTLAIERGFQTSFTYLAHQYGSNSIGHKVVRQLNLEPYGIADIVIFYRYRGIIRVDLIELKARPIELKDFEQICRYNKGISVYLGNTLKWSDFDISMYLVGTQYDPMFLHNQVPISVVEYSYHLSGIDFEQHGVFANWRLPAGQNRSFPRINSKGLLAAKPESING